MDYIVEEWVLNHDNYAEIRLQHEKWPFGYPTPHFVQPEIGIFIRERSSKFIQEKFGAANLFVGEQVRGNIIEDWLHAGYFLFNEHQKLELTETGWDHYRKRIMGKEHYGKNE